MLKKIYRELAQIRKELHAIRNSMEPVSETGMSKSVSAENFKVRTKEEDKPTAEVARTAEISAVLDNKPRVETAQSAKISAVLNEITSKRYRGV